MMDTFIPGQTCVDPNLRSIEAHTSCVHELEYEEVFGGDDKPDMPNAEKLHSLKVRGVVWISVRLPVDEGGVISGDSSTWEVSHEVGLGGWGILTFGDWNAEAVEKRNAKMREKIKERGNVIEAAKDVPSAQD